jgi:plasmid stability protein
VPTLTIRKVPERIVKSLKACARARHRSVEQEMREMLEERFPERSLVFAQIEAGWEKQARRPSAKEIESWIKAGRG